MKKSKNAENKIKYEIVESQVLAYDSKTKKYSVKTSLTVINNNQRTKLKIIWSNINLQRFIDLNFYEYSGMNDSDLGSLYIKFSESSIVISFENELLEIPKENTANVEIKFSIKAKQKDRLIKAINHLVELDKKEQKKDPYDN